MKDDPTAVPESEPLILFDEEDPQEDFDEPEEEESEEVPEPGEGVDIEVEEEPKEDSEKESEEESEEEPEEDPRETLAELLKARDALIEDVKSQRHRAQEAEARLQSLESAASERARAEQEAAEQRLKEALDSGELDPTEHKVQELESEIAQMRAYREQMAVKDEVMRIAPAIVEREKAFISEHPDYGEAMAHLHSQVAPQLMAKGYQEWEIPGLLERLDLAFGVSQMRAGVDPARSLYDQAVRMGYQPKQNTSGTPEDAPGASTSQQAGPTTGQKPSGAPGGLEAMAAKAGVNRRKSLSNTSGGVSPGGKGVKITQEDYAQLPEEDQERVMSILRANPRLDEQFEVDGFVRVEL